MNFNNCCPQQICVAPPRVRVVNRCHYKNVLHVQPIHTHYVNNQINCHRFVPKYSCSTEFNCQDVTCGCGNNIRY